MPRLEWKIIVIELPIMFLSFGFLYLGILGFKSDQYFCELDFCIFNTHVTLWFLLVYLLPSNIFCWVLFSFYKTPEDTKFTQLKNNLSQTNCLVFVIFLIYKFHLPLAALYFVGWWKNYPILSCWIGFMCFFMCVFYVFFLVFS